MAIITFNDGTKENMNPEEARGVWAVLNGDVEGTEAQQKFCSKVKEVHLNWRNAPDSYLFKHSDIIRELVLCTWMSDYEGNLTGPELEDENSWRVSKKLGLWENGGPSSYVLQYNRSHTSRGRRG